MAKSKTVEGKDLMLFLDGKTVALAKSCSIEISRESQDAASKDDGVWKEDSPGDMSWTASTEALYPASISKDIQTTHDELFKAMVDGKDILVVWSPISNAAEGKYGIPTDGWKMDEESVDGKYMGNAHVTQITLNADKGSPSSVSIQMTGNGALQNSLTVVV